MAFGDMDKKGASTQIQEFLNGAKEWTNLQKQGSWASGMHRRMAVCSAGIPLGAIAYASALVNGVPVSGGLIEQLHTPCS